MKILKTLSEFNQVRRGSVLTIGNFDGVHVGHQEIFRTAREIARAHDTEMVVMTFEPHPVAVLHPERAPGVLTPLSLKIHLLREFADDCLIILQDNQELLSLEPEDFVDKFLMASIAPSAIVEGDDFHFGARRAGDIETLRRFGSRKGFDVAVVSPKHIELSTGQALRVSSTMIRYMLESGHVAEAAIALSRPHRLIGPIVSGWGRGRKLGFPTLNMGKPDQIIPAEGVYMGYVTLAPTPEAILAEAHRLPAVFSIGEARTFGDEHPLLIEAHLLVDVVPDTTGHWMAMDFLHHLRHQHKFTGPEELVAQISKDCDQARTLFEELAEGDGNE
jgi:riboflavin kinase/FMN adenylyltransferase